MELPIFGDNKDIPRPARDFSKCAGCAMITICHPDAELPADAEPAHPSERCANFVQADAPPENDSVH